MMILHASPAGIAHQYKEDRPLTAKEQVLALVQDMEPEDQQITAHVIKTNRRTGRHLTETERETLYTYIERDGYQRAHEYLDSIE